MSYICSKCDELPGPLTQEMLGMAGSACVCGGTLEEIDEDILKAFMPFAPAQEAPASARAGHRWGWMLKLIGMDDRKKVINLPPEERTRVVHALAQKAKQQGRDSSAFLNSNGYPSKAEMTLALPWPSGEK